MAEQGELTRDAAVEAINLAERWRVAGRRLRTRNPEAFARHVRAMQALVAGWAAAEVRCDDEIL